VRKESSGSEIILESPNDDPEWHITTPRKIASEIATFGYGFDVQPYMEELVYRAYTFIKPSSFSIEQTLIGAKMDNVFCFTNLSQSPAMLHSVLFSTQAFRDMSLRLPPSDVARWHQTQTLIQLRGVLEDKVEGLKTSTMAVVASLAMAAVFGGDLETARMHIDGLWRIIEVKGGWDAVGRGGMIEHKAQRLDFALALSTGRPVRYMPEKQSWSPAIAFDNARKFPDLSMIQPRPEPKLLNIWADVRQFALAANQATSTNVKMPPSMMKKLATSVPWRLTNLEYDLCSQPLHELVRLTMLAFVKSILASISGLGRAMKYVSYRSAAILQTQPRTQDRGMHALLLWTGFVAAVAIWEDLDDQEWLVRSLLDSTGALDLTKWAEVRAVLKGYPWIDIVYDQPAEAIFNKHLCTLPAPP